METNTKRGKRLAKYIPDYVVFDLETTGVSWMKDSIIEISAVKVRQGKIVDTFSTLVDPERSIPWQASSVNGITDEMVAGAPKLTEALTDFLKFVGDEVLVGHNIHTFDMKFIYKAAEELLGQDVENDYLDTLSMARSCLPELAHHKLVDLADYFHISSEGAHRALNDCMMNQQCFEEMAKIQEKVPMKLCPKCGGELVKRKGKFGEFYGCSNYPGCRHTAKA